jgi:hypothetical protein
MSASESLRSAWFAAAKELGIEVGGPTQVSLSDGRIFEFPVLVPQFGSERGMLLHTTYGRDACLAAAKMGYGFSILDPSTGASDDADLDGYIDCLKDWGWVADGSPPSWYSSEREEEL